MLPDNETRQEELTPKEQKSSEESIDTASDILDNGQNDNPPEQSAVTESTDTDTEQSGGASSKNTNIDEQVASDDVESDTQESDKAEQADQTEQIAEEYREDKKEEDDSETADTKSDDDVDTVEDNSEEIVTSSDKQESEDNNNKDIDAQVDSAEDQDEQETATDEQKAEDAEDKEDNVEEHDDKETATDSEDNTAQEEDQTPEIELSDLDDYRESVPQDEPTGLVDIKAFLEMKRRAKEEEGDKKKKKKKKGADIFVNRYKAKSINAAVAAAQPIMYFYNAVLDKVGQIIFFNVYQVLQDRFMGKLIPQQYTAVAEGSSKIEELNIANVIEQVKICNEYPQYGFVVSVSTRFFTRPNILEKLCKEIDAVKHNNLILAFDCVSLQNIGTAAKTGLSILRIRGAKVMLDNTEQVSMATLTDLEYDYIRIDARYYEKGAERPLAYLELLSRFAASQGIVTAATFCDEAYLAEYMLSRGITGVQGDSVSRPMRTVPNAVNAVTKLASMIVED